MILGYLKRKEGSAFIITLVVMAIFVILCSAILSFAIDNRKMSIDNSLFHSSYYIAESGLTYVVSELKNNIENIYFTSANQTDFFNKVHSFITDTIARYKNFEYVKVRGFTPAKAVRIEEYVYSNYSGNTAFYKLSSYGEIDGVRRKIEQSFIVEYPEPFESEFAIFAGERLELDKKGNVIKGSIALASDNIFKNENANSNHISVDLSQISLDKDSYFYINENVYHDLNYNVPKNLGENNLSRLRILEPRTYEFSHIPDMNIDNKVTKDSISYIKLEKDTYIPTLISDGELKVKVDTTVNLLVDTLDVKGDLIIDGIGKLRIYVKESLYIGGDVSIKYLPVPPKLYIYYYNDKIENNTISLGEFCGILYVNKANIRLKKGASFKGHIISGGDEIELLGSDDSYQEINGAIFAPFASITVKNKCRINGVVICDRFIAEGSELSIYYDEPEFFADYPYKPTITDLTDLLHVSHARESDK